MSGMRRWAERHPFWVLLPIETVLVAVGLHLGGDPLVIAIGGFVGGWVAHQTWAQPTEEGERR